MAVSSGHAFVSGIACPNRTAAPAKANSVSVWPSPCLTISASSLRRVAIEETAALGLGRRAPAKKADYPFVDCAGFRR
jgi:hypothetical protein